MNEYFIKESLERREYIEKKKLTLEEIKAHIKYLIKLEKFVDTQIEEERK
jgi:hypothetical protein